MICASMPREVPRASAANLLYDHAFPVFRWLYGPWKRLTERQDAQLLRRLVGPGDTVIDVGANIGHYTLQLASLVGAYGQVLAIEPDPRNAGWLRSRIVDRPNVRLHQAATGSRTGEIRVFLSRSSAADHRTFDLGDDRLSIPVDCGRLDDLVPTGRPVRLVKVDVQGNEGRCSQGRAASSTKARTYTLSWIIGYFA